jgi:hypothetical protein
MRNSLWLPVVLFASLVPAACGNAEVVPNPASGGTTASGGSGQVGGSADSSGGVANASGGATASGGVSGPTGGRPSGGNPSTGGVAGPSGGSPPTGGFTGLSGGTTSLSGGTASLSGGTTGMTGGTANRTGGTTSMSGGVPGSTGGVGTCTDTPPPNGDTCAHAVQYAWCGQPWMNGTCALSCGTCGTGNTGGTANATGGTGNATGGATGPTGGKATGGTATATGGTATASGGKATGGTATASGGTGTSTCGSTTNPAITGSTGYATRYWDCCKPSCSWTTAVPACGKDGSSKITDRNAKSGCDSGGTAFECYNFAPWYDSATNMSYGFAAHNGVSCGACFQLQFTGTSHNGGANPGAQAIGGQQMIVQVINIGGIASEQFDLLIPGGGVGAMTAGCTAQWGSVDLGATYGGLLSECNADVACTRTKCQSVFAGKTDLLAGCAWFTDCFKGADNPNIIYKQVSCPSQITSKSGLSG